MSKLTKQALNEINDFVKFANYNKTMADVFQHLDEAIMSAKMMASFDVEFSASLMASIEYAMDGCYKLMKNKQEGSEEIPSVPEELKNLENSEGENDGEIQTADE